ncbi:MAG: thioredoxin domain-containing protein, partial [Bacteroidia bacterium]|nr:thioredoxin domain-containing protein [Bacteroidia bacterium]
MSHKFTNQLVNETSPYLLQHAHNPVNWMPWNDKTLEHAKNKNKLILISIGYASCHWCHVMEHESFEDTLVAQTMNTNFVNIKVDREERPDIDQVYMNAVQLMTGRGGWPLNVVALPDGRPVWGGTYFKKDQWINVLEQLANLHEKDPDKLLDYASKLEQGIKSMDMVVLNKEEPVFKIGFIDNVVSEWSKSFDHKKGGSKRAPKFMMPNNYQFLLRHAYQNDDTELQEFVNLTLTKMALGGIYDQLGGGFSRYSVDNKWHVPHFEKMLYDNAQLVSLYSDAYLITKNELYKQVVYETLGFIEKELTSAEGVFYSSLDADSLNKNNELVEGAFYVWQKEELKNLLKDDYEVFSNYYNINNYGYWEHDNYVLIRNQEDEEFVRNHKLNIEKFKAKKKEWKQILLQEREKRSKPRLDDKTLTSWNSLMIKGYLDAYRVFQDRSFLNIAMKNANFILTKQINSDGSLFRNYKEGTSSINAYLIDYATTIEAFISLYQATSDEKWLYSARNLSNYSFDNYYDESSNMFFFTSIKDPKLVTRNIDFRDNVIPSSNSIMAKNLFKLSHYFENTNYLKTATSMLNNVKPEMATYGSG